MGRLIVVLAVAGAAAVAVARPGSSSRAHSSLPTVSAAAVHSEDALAAARRDLEKRQAEVGLVGAAPLFGAEGLPKPAAH
jgi:hypothetical protein